MKANSEPKNVKERIGNLIDADVETHEFEPDRSPPELGIGTERVAFAASNGVANVAASDGWDIEIELK